MKIQDSTGVYYQVTFDRAQWVVSTLGDPSRGPKWASWDAERQTQARREFESGEGNWKELSYHNRMSHALAWLSDRLSGAQPAKDLAELRAFVEDAHERIERAAQLVSGS